MESFAGKTESEIPAHREILQIYNQEECLVNLSGKTASLTTPNPDRTRSLRFIPWHGSDLYYEIDTRCYASRQTRSHSVADNQERPFTMTTKDSFADDLKQRYQGCHRRGRNNYVMAYLVLIGAVATSALATFSVASNLWSKEINAILAAAPGILYLLNRRFRFEDRAKWWWDKYHIIEGLYRALVRENRAEADVSKELSQELKKLEARWPVFEKTSGRG
jgi:hypothetical protein